MSQQPQQPIRIVRKKKVAHAGHHGGAWKVAYADFVTAMMAFFIVMWLVGQNEKVKDAVSGYFTSPAEYAEKVAVMKTMGGGMGIMEGGVPARSDVAASAGKGGGAIMVVKERESLKEKATKIKELISKVPQFDKMKEHVNIEMTNDGLRIQLTESDKGVFFQSGSSNLGGSAQDVLKILAKELATLQNPLIVEGHTDSQPYVSSTGYSNWELSADRANSARRFMESSGYPATQVTEVRGYADRRLAFPDPFDARNRRISIIVRFMETPAVEGAEGAQREEAAEPKREGEISTEVTEEPKHEQEPPPAPPAEEHAKEH